MSLKCKVFKIIFLNSALIFCSAFSNAQTFERKAGESKEDFAWRIIPAGTTLEFVIAEHKFNSPGKKIVCFYKIHEKDTSINKTDSVRCIYADILLPENENSKKYSFQTLHVECNRDYNCAIESATIQNNKKEKSVELNISFVQINRASTRLLLKTYKTFLLKQNAVSGRFSIEEEKE